MPTTKLTWNGSRKTLELLETELSELAFQPADAVSLTKHDVTKSDAVTEWTLEAYFASKPNQELLDGYIEIAGSPVIEELEDIDWVAHSLEGLGVVKAGRFTLYGIHDKNTIEITEEDIPIRIDANMAFGTGHHPTTAGCLTLLDRLGGMAPRSILDLGCGSAVLSIAAVKLWDRSVLATDIDADSVEIARENATQNGVDNRINFVTADGFEHSDIFNEAPFDFIFANILAGPLVELASHMNANTTRSARIMLAGLMTEQEETVTKAYTDEGFRLINRLDQAVWPVLLFAKP